MNSNLIPFGLNPETGELVDVSEVSRGKECGCICQSCKTPLEARQGDQNEWHFAHSSKSVSDKTENECDYSFWTSILLMVKQVMTSIEHITLPELVMWSKDQKITIQEEKIITCGAVLVEKHHGGVYFDALIQIQDYSIGIIFDTPNKPVFLAKSQCSKIDRLGVIEISLMDTESLIFRKGSKGRYTEILKDFICADVSSKKWLYHPRERKYNGELADYPQTTQEYDIESEYLGSAKKDYECAMCKKEWHGKNSCGKCMTHLYSREKRSLTSA